MNPLMTVIAAIGVPLAVLLLFSERLCGMTPRAEGFGDLARSIGIAFYSGIATLALAAAAVLFMVYAR